MHMRRGISRLAIGALLPLAIACTSTKEMPELPSTFPEKTPPGFEESVEARIESSLPEVSYSLSSPRFPELVKEASVNGESRIDPQQLEELLRQLETLEGQPVLCRTASGKVFGECVFPAPISPVEEAEDSESAGE